MNQEKIGKFIAELRKEKGLKQSELAEMVGLSDKAVSKWECGKSIPDIGILNSLSEALGVTVTELLNGERIKTITTDEIQDITTSSIKFYNNKTEHKFKKIIKILITIILLISFFLLSIFVINNYNTCNLYTIKSKDENYSASGNLIYTNSKNVLVIGDIMIRDITGFKDKQIINYEYILLNDKRTITRVGDITDFENNQYNYNKTIDECLKEIEIYIYMQEGNNVFDNINLEKDFELKIKYKTVDDDYEEIIIPLSIEKEFSNNQLIYDGLFEK